MGGARTYGGHPMTGPIIRRRIITEKKMLKYKKRLEQDISRILFLHKTGRGGYSSDPLIAQGV
jgi:hypothetical protein